MALESDKKVIDTSKLADQLQAVAMATQEARAGVGYISLLMVHGMQLPWQARENRVGQKHRRQRKT